jgi:hypothetical protein
VDNCLWITVRKKCAPLAGSYAIKPGQKCAIFGGLHAGDKPQEASAFCFSWSNSAWLIAPLSSRLFADAIWSAGLPP